MSDRPSAGLGFVDVLIGAMSSAILLFMAQASQPPRPALFGEGSGRLVIVLNDPPPGQNPNLAIRFRLDRKVSSPADLAAAGDRRVIVGDGEDGRQSYDIRFSANARFADGDELYVYLHDIGGGPNGLVVSLNAVVSGPDGTQKFDLNDAKYRLTARTPMLSVPLAQVSGQSKGTRIDWRLR